MTAATQPFLAFVKRALIVFLPVWLVLVSFALWTAGYYVSNQHLQVLLYGVAGAILSGGVFAAILKSLQFTSLFRDEISKVLFADVDWLVTLHSDQLRSIWKNVIRASIRRGAPSLADKISDHIILQMLPRAEDYSYSQMFQRTILDGYDPATDVLTVVDEFELMINAHDPNAEIRYAFKLTGEWPAIFTTHPYSIGFLQIDGIDRVAEVEQTGAAGGGAASVEYVIKLQGKSQYKVIRRMVRLHRIGTDPVQQVIATRYTDSMILAVENRVPKLVSASLIPISIDSSAMAHQKIGANVDRWQVSSLVFPGQGLMLVFSKA